MKKTENGMRYEIYHRPGQGKKGRDYIAITPDCIGGFAFGKTEKNALRALKRIYKKSKKISDLNSGCTAKGGKNYDSKKNKKRQKKL